MTNHRPASFEIIRRTVLDWWDAWIQWTVAGLFWTLGCLTIVLGPPATFALVAAAHRMADRGETSHWRDMVADGRRYFAVSWLWMVLNLVMIALVPLNLSFYARLPAPWNSLVQALLVLLTGLWLVVQLFTLPYLMEQEHVHLGVAMRNALYTVLAAPGLSIVVSILGLVVAAASVALVAPLLLGAPGFIALLASHSVNERLETYGIREKPAPVHPPDEVVGQAPGEAPGRAPGP